MCFLPELLMIVSSLFVRREILARLDGFLKAHRWLISYSENGQKVIPIHTNSSIREEISTWQFPDCSVALIYPAISVTSRL